MNLLPIPILDGGQILFTAIEWLRGKPIPYRVSAVTQLFGLVLIILLGALAIFSDIGYFIK
jgi:regulator of sigma E protease